MPTPESSDKYSAVVAAFRQFIKEVQQAEGDYGIGIAMTKAEEFLDALPTGALPESGERTERRVRNGFRSPERRGQGPATTPTVTQIIEAVARGWCTPENAHKEFDATLGEAIAKQVLGVIRSTSGALDINALADKLHGMGDSAYCRACDLSRQDLCLGEEAKIAHAQFTVANLKALEAVRAKFGEAEGYWNAAKVVRDILSASGTTSKE